MRRALNIAFFLAALAVGAILYWRHAKEAETPKVSPPTTSTMATAPAPPPRVAPPPPNRNTAAPAPDQVKDEATLMQQVRALVKIDPARAEALARDGRTRFPDSADADERDALLVDALINQQHIGAARSETYYYFDHHPAGRFTAHLFAMTGVHPPPRGPGH